MKISTSELGLKRALGNYAAIEKKIMKSMMHNYGTLQIRTNFNIMSGNWLANVEICSDF